MFMTPMGFAYWRWQIIDFSESLLMDENRAIYKMPRPQADMEGFVRIYTPLVSCIPCFLYLIITLFRQHNDCVIYIII